MKMTFHGRRPQKWKIGISQQHLVRSYPNLKLRLRGPSHMLWNLKEWKTASKMKSIRISQQHLVWTYPNLKLRLRGPSQMLWKLKMKTTFHGWWPQKRKVGASQQHLVWTYPNLKHRLRGPSQMLWKLKYSIIKIDNQWEDRQQETENVWRYGKWESDFGKKEMAGGLVTKLILL